MTPPRVELNQPLLFVAFMVAAIACNQVWKLYQVGEDPIEAVRGITFQIDKGESIAIMGPSGCGKTTLLNLLSGIDDPTAGVVEVNGKPLQGISDNEKTMIRSTHLGFIFQQFNLLPVLTALENVELPLLLNNMDATEARMKAKEALDLVGLSDRISHRPAELSGGQQQRVAIARAFVHQPDVILCDEPTGNLDSDTGNEILQLLLQLNRQHDTTLVIVTHDETIAGACSRILRMADGVVLQEEE